MLRSDSESSKETSSLDSSAKSQITSSEQTTTSTHSARSVFEEKGAISEFVLDLRILLIKNVLLFWRSK